MSKDRAKIWDSIRNNEDVSEIKRGTLKDVLNGRILLKDFFQRQSGLIMLVVFLSFMYIGNRYYCENQHARINKLRSELTDATYEELTITADLTKMSRRSNTLQLLNANGLKLEENTEPPIIID